MAYILGYFFIVYPLGVIAIVLVCKGLAALIRMMFFAAKRHWQRKSGVVAPTTVEMGLTAAPAMGYTVSASSTEQDEEEEEESADCECDGLPTCGATTGGFLLGCSPAGDASVALPEMPTPLVPPSAADNCHLWLAQCSSSTLQWQRQFLPATQQRHSAGLPRGWRHQGSLPQCIKYDAATLGQGRLTALKHFLHPL